MNLAASLEEASQMFLEKAKAAPFSTWLIVDNEDIRREALRLIKSPVLYDHVTTVNNLSHTILKMKKSDIRIISSDEQYLLISSFARDVFGKSKTTNALVESLIDLYFALTLNKVVCPTDTVKKQNASEVFLRYTEWCKNNSATDYLTAICVATKLLDEGCDGDYDNCDWGNGDCVNDDCKSIFQKNVCILYRLKSTTPLGKDLLEKFADTKIIIQADATLDTDPESLKETLPKTTEEVTVYKNLREEIQQTLEKICRLEEAGVAGEEIMLLTPSLQSTLPLLEEITHDFFVCLNDSNTPIQLSNTSIQLSNTPIQLSNTPVQLSNTPTPLTFTVSGTKSIRNIPVIRAVLAWVASSGNAKKSDIQLILSCPNFHFNRGAITAGRIEKAVMMAGDIQTNFEWRHLADKLAASRHEDWQKAADAKVQDVISLILDLAENRQKKAKTLRERIAALRSDLNNLKWTTSPMSKQEDAARRKFLWLLDSLETSYAAYNRYSLKDFVQILSRGCVKTASVHYPENATAFRVGKLSAAAGIKVPHVFIIGLTAKNIPSISFTLPLLTAQETHDILPDRYKQMAEESEYFFKAAIMSASKSLHLSYSESDGRNSHSPSQYLTRYTEATRAISLPLIHSITGCQKMVGNAIFTRSTTLRENIAGIKDATETAQRIDVETNSRVTDGEYTAIFEGTESEKLFSEIYSKKLFVSPTFLEHYAECPFKWYLTHHLKLENPQDYHAENIVLGNVIHRVMERYFREHDCITEDTADVAFDELSTLTKEEMEKVKIDTPSWDATYLKYHGTDLVTGTLKALIELEIEFSKQGYKTHPEWLERNVAADLEDVVVKGRVDRVLQKDTGEFMVLDYKTGALKKKSDVLEGKALQLPLYTEAIRQEAVESGEPCTPDTGRYLQISPKEVKALDLYGGDAKKSIDDAIFAVSDILERIEVGHCKIADSCNDEYCQYKYICRKSEMSNDGDE